MPTRVEFQGLAEQRLSDAQALYNTGSNYDGAFYLAGYAVEYALKASICKVMDADIYDVTGRLKDETKSLRTHNFKVLVLFSGLSKQLAADPTVQAAHSYIFQNSTNEWNEQRRYNATGITQRDCQDFLSAVNDLITWIRQHW